MDGETYTALFEAPGGKPITEAYPDPLTGGEPFTIGLGHTGPEVQKGTIWPEDRCWAVFYNNYAVARSTALHLVGATAWTSLLLPRQAVITDMAFNIGSQGVAGFPKMLAAVRRADWQSAAGEILSSLYARQVKNRAVTNAQVLLWGRWPITQSA